MKGAEQQKYAGGEQEREDGQEDCTVRRAPGRFYCSKWCRWLCFYCVLLLFDCAQEKSALLGKGQHSEDNGSNGKIL